MVEVDVPFKVEAFANYIPQSDSEIPLTSGKIYDVYQIDDSGHWWQTEVEGKKGWFPSSYARVFHGQNNMIVPMKLDDPFGHHYSNVNIEVKLEVQMNNSSLNGANYDESKMKLKCLNEEFPIPSRAPKVEKGSVFAPCYFVVHVVEARNLKIGKEYETKLCPRAYIIRYDVNEGKEEKNISY